MANSVVSGTLPRLFVPWTQPKKAAWAHRCRRPPYPGAPPARPSAAGAGSKTLAYAILLFIASDLASLTSHIHKRVLFLLWLHPFILSGVISPLHLEGKQRTPLSS